MKVLLGECGGAANVELLRGLGWGRMWIGRDRFVRPYPGEPWGIDNGAYIDWQAGEDPDPARFRWVLENRLPEDSTPYLAVIPDAPTNAERTLEMLDQFFEEDWPYFPWYVAVQDGMDTFDLEPYVEKIDGVFLGGSDAFKATAGEWCEWAHGAGLPFHYARCGTQEKLAHAIDIGADSIDSALPLMHPGRLRAFVETVQNGPAQVDMFRRFTAAGGQR